MNAASPHDDAPRTLRWPAERFYWAMLDAPGWSRAGVVPPGLLAALEEEVPLPIGDLHAVCTPVLDPCSPSASPTRVVICACPVSELASLDPSITELTPERVPPEMNVAADGERLNLLAGRFEPAPIAAARRRRHLIAAAGVLVCSVIASTGLVRRAHRAQMVSEQASRAANAVLAAATPDRREQSLARILRSAQELAEVTRRVRPPRDAAEDFEALLKAWPSAPCKPQSVSAVDGGVSIALIVSGDPAPLLKSFAPPPGMVLDEPRLAAAGDVTRINLHLRPQRRADP